MMILSSINWVEVMVASVASMVIGFLWYGPVFGKVWVQIVGWTEAEIAEGKKKGMMASYFLNFVASIVTMAILQFFFDKFGVVNATQAVEYAFGIWLGFIAPVKYGSIILWGKNPSWTLFWIEAGYQMVNLVVAGLIFVII